MDSGLIVFLKSSKAVEKEDLDLILGYRLSKVVCVVYDYTMDMLDGLEMELVKHGKTVDFIEAEGRDDIYLDNRIRTISAANSGSTYIDVTFASPFHAALLMNLGGSEKVEIWVSGYDKDGSVKRTRMDRTKYIYNGLPDTCYLILDMMSKEPILTDVIIEGLRWTEGKDPKGCRGKTAVYDSLEQLVLWGLIDRCSGQLPEGYKARRPHFYNMNEDQLWDYYSYKRLQKKRDDDLKEARKQKVLAEQSNKEAKRIAPTRKRKNPRRK